MIRIVISLAIVLLFPCFAYSAELLEKVESAVYKTEGTKQEIAKKAKRCIASEVANEEVRIADSTSGTSTLGGLLAADIGKGKSDGLHGGETFIDIDIESGSIVANNRVNYRSKFLAYNVKSKLKFLAKDGRFKIRHTNIQYVQKNTGYSHNSGYMDIAKVWGTGWKDAVKALNGVSAKVAKCVQNNEQEEDW